jgi:hypothetical protein
LNLTQAIEVFSNQYRKEEANKVAKKNRKDEGNRKDKVYLKDKIEDILAYLQLCVDIKPGYIQSLAEKIADMRNFFTHYNKNKTKPSYKEISYASHFLRFVLLALIYKQLGIGEKYIKEARNAFSGLDGDMEILMEGRTGGQKLNLEDWT